MRRFLLLLLVVVPVVVAVPYEYAGAIDAGHPQVSFSVPVHLGQVVSVSPQTRPEMGEAQVRVRLEKEPGFVLAQRVDNVSAMSWKSDSERLKLKFTPFGINSSVTVVVESSHPASVILRVDVDDVFDASSGLDAGNVIDSALDISAGDFEGYIASPLERLVVEDAAFSDDVDWYKLRVPSGGKKVFVELSPNPKGLFAVRVIAADGQPIYNQTAQYVFEKLRFFVELNGYEFFFVQVGPGGKDKADFSRRGLCCQDGGGNYRLSVVHYDANYSAEQVLYARQAVITPLAMLAQEEGGWQRFWHVIVISMFGVMAAAMMTAYHLGKSRKAKVHQQTPAEYVRFALHKGFSREIIEKRLKDGGYSAKMVSDAFGGKS